MIFFFFLFCTFRLVNTTTSQSFSTQINSTTKMSTTIATATTVDPTKHSARPHQILSRETSFISKPTISASDEKDESQLSTVSTTVSSGAVPTAKTHQISVPAAISTGISTSTVTITSKSFVLYFSPIFQMKYGRHMSVNFFYG